ncbi:putative oxidoreductase protein [Ostreococcus tauri]|nr:putative oxidoreductase protein [Ostreococcus tauri]
MLTALLMPKLMKSDDARVVALSSVTTWFGSNKYHYYYKGASKTKGNYGSSKLACLAMTVEMQRRIDAAYPNNNVSCVAADPGFVASDIWRDFNPVVRKIMGVLALSPAQGAMTSVNAASLKSIKKATLYMPFSIRMSKLFKLNRGAAYTFGMPLLSKIFAGFGADAMAPRAKNAETNAALWDLSVQFCKDNGLDAKKCEALKL